MFSLERNTAQENHAGCVKMLLAAGVSQMLAIEVSRQKKKKKSWASQT